MNMEPIDTAARDKALADWQAASDLLATAKADEMEKRKAAFPIIFGTEAKVGTNRVPLANGWAVKGVRKITYTLEKELEKVIAVDTELRAFNDPEAGLLAGRILKRVYDLSESEYKKLDLTNPTHIRVKQMLDAIITTKDGAPTLELEPPKGAK